MSGLLMRRVAAGPNALRGSGPNRFTRTRKCDDPSGFSRSPERPYLHYVVMPSPIRCNPRSTLDYAASESNVGSLKRSPRTIMAHAIRAILLASATAATLIGRRSMIRASQSRFVPCCRAYRMTAIDPAMSNHRKYRLPCFEIPPRRSLPPVECLSYTIFASVVATIGPTPGISSSRRLSSHDRYQA